MLRLIKNENMKLYRRPRTWILVLLLVGIAAFASYQIHRVQPAPADWKQAVTADSQNYEKYLQDDPSPEARAYYEGQLKLNQYRLDHEVPPTTGTAWGTLLDLSQLIILVTIFTVIAAADAVAGEFSQGTVKLLLIRPHSRAKILLAKYLAALQFSFFLLLVLLASSYGFGVLWNGFDASIPNHLYQALDGTVHEQSLLVHVLTTYGLSCVSLLMTVTLAFMISTVFRSSSLAIALSMAVLLLSNTAVSLLKGYWWIKYYLFANTDLSVYLDGTARGDMTMINGTGGPLRTDMTLTFSILVLVGYFIAMNALSWAVFTKRDVAA